MLPRTLRKILLRDPRLRPIVGQPMEQQREEVSAEIIADEIDDIAEPIVPIWLQILEQEAAQMLGEDEQ
jgi:hypothetical protein